MPIIGQFYAGPMRPETPASFKLGMVLLLGIAAAFFWVLSRTGAAPAGCNLTLSLPRGVAVAVDGRALPCNRLLNPEENAATRLFRCRVAATSCRVAVTMPDGTERVHAITGLPASGECLYLLRDGVMLRAVP